MLTVDQRQRLEESMELLNRMGQLLDEPNFSVEQMKKEISHVRTHLRYTLNEPNLAAEKLMKEIDLRIAKNNEEIMRLFRTR